MYAADIHFDITTVDITQMYPLGFLVHQPARAQASGSTTAPSAPPINSGGRTWVYVFNDEAATAFAQGTIVARDAATTTYDGILAPVDTATMRLLGVAQHAIAALAFGFILKDGLGEVLADTGGITADTALIVGNVVAGRADNVAAGTAHAFAWSTETVAATALATCRISCPG